MKYGLKRQKSINSHAESISAWCTVFDWLSMVAAFKVSRQGPASSSAARFSTAARTSQVVSDQSRQAFRAAVAAASTSAAPAWWKVASTWPWSCGQPACTVSPVCTSRPPMITGISTVSPSISLRRRLSDFFSGEPGSYSRTGSLVGVASGKMAFIELLLEDSGMRSRPGWRRDAGGVDCSRSHPTVVDRSPRSQSIAVDRGRESAPCASAVHLVMDVSARHADRFEAGEHRLEKARLRLLALLAGGLALELADARPASEDVRRGGIGDVFAQQRLGDPAGANVGAVTGDVRLAAQRVHDLEPARMAGSQLLELAAEDDVVPGLVAVDQDVAQLHPGLEAVPDDAQVGDDPGTGADVDQAVGARLEAGWQDVRTAEAGEHHAGAGGHAIGQERRHQRRVLGDPREVELLLDRHRQPAVVRRRAHRIGPRRLPLALDVLEEFDEAIQRRELVRPDGEELSGLVLHPLAAGEEHQGGGVGGLADRLLDDGLELADARAGSPGPRLGSLLEGRIQHVVLIRSRRRRCRGHRR